ncbi:hypothetical protein FGADI_2334 [Fusarium gaditjirri]|uniref:Uncharacterized protein n=1 Tax=Fusarium gaditjirri TaxID=282569 RepID=A0A8H4X2C7_9HYPO|nr:hypothetical protein FGADI_2334 [Fusarium gaditjirri]
MATHRTFLLLPPKSFPFLLLLFIFHPNITNSRFRASGTMSAQQSSTGQHSQVANSNAQGAPDIIAECRMQTEALLSKLRNAESAARLTDKKLSYHKSMHENLIKQCRALKQANEEKDQEIENLKYSYNQLLSEFRRLQNETR